MNMLSWIEYLNLVYWNVWKPVSATELKIIKVIVTFYLKILTFFLAIVNLYRYSEKKFVWIEKSKLTVAIKKSELWVYLAKLCL